MSILAIETYVGMPVRAVRLTSENAPNLAKWIGGQHSARNLTIKSDDGKNTIKVTRVYLDRAQRRRGDAWHYGSVGDWFVMDSEGFVRIFPDEKFKSIFLKRDALEDFFSGKFQNDDMITREELFTTDTTH